MTEVPTTPADARVHFEEMFRQANEIDAENCTPLDVARLKVSCMRCALFIMENIPALQAAAVATERSIPSSN